MHYIIILSQKLQDSSHFVNKSTTWFQSSSHFGWVQTIASRFPSGRTLVLNSPGGCSVHQVANKWSVHTPTIKISLSPRKTGCIQTLCGPRNHLGCCWLSQVKTRLFCSLFSLEANLIKFLCLYPQTAYFSTSYAALQLLFTL